MSVFDDSEKSTWPWSEVPMSAAPAGSRPARADHARNVAACRRGLGSCDLSGLSEVEAAQKEILAVVQRMAESGDLILGGKGGEEYV